MEISWTPERVGLVKGFFQENGIPLWKEDVNPLLDPDFEPDNETMEAEKRHSSHCIRVLIAWWKAAHYVQNWDTADYYTQLVGRIVPSHRNCTETYHRSLHRYKTGRRAEENPQGNVRL